MSDVSNDNAWRPPRAPSRPAEELEGYADLVEIGRGGDRVVYRARDVALERDVAIKVLLGRRPGDGPRGSAARSRSPSSSAASTRNIVTVLAVGTTAAGRPAIVMDFYERGSLHDRLRAHGPLAVDEAVAVGVVVADALAFAHAHGVLHRDVKPQNVLVLPTSWVLADFGIARLVDSEHTASVETFTYRHASPQMLDGLPPTAADDVWSLGSTLFTLLDGRPPFASDDPDEDSALAYLRRVRTEPHRALAVTRRASGWWPSSTAAWPRTSASGSARPRSCATRWPRCGCPAGSRARGAADAGGPGPSTAGRRPRRRRGRRDPGTRAGRAAGSAPPRTGAGPAEPDAGRPCRPAARPAPAPETPPDRDPGPAGRRPVRHRPPGGADPTPDGPAGRSRRRVLLIAGRRRAGDRARPRASPARCCATTTRGRRPRRAVGRRDVGRGAADARRRAAADRPAQPQRADPELAFDFLKLDQRRLDPDAGVERPADGEGVFVLSERARSPTCSTQFAARPPGATVRFPRSAGDGPAS